MEQLHCSADWRSVPDVVSTDEPDELMNKLSCLREDMIVNACGQRSTERHFLNISLSFRRLYTKVRSVQLGEESEAEPLLPLSKKKINTSEKENKKKICILLVLESRS